MQMYVNITTNVCFYVDKHSPEVYHSSAFKQNLKNIGVNLEPAFEYIFPAIRGIQANHEYYVSMCPLKLIPKIFVFDDEELTPELRAQRILNKNRMTGTNYIDL